jgi:predicted HTH transcriptional regulator
VNAVAHRDYNSTGSVQVSVFRNRIVVRNPGTLPVELTKADLMKEHGSYPHNPYLAEVLYQMSYIEKYGTGITENIRRMQESRLLAPEIDLSAEFVTTIWRDSDATESSNVATNIGTDDSTNDIDNTLVDKPNDIANVATGNTNVATGNLNVATDHLAENKRIVDEIVKRKVHSKMSPAQIKECIIEACIVEHSIEELALLLNKTPAHLRNRFIPNLVADGILLPTKPRHTKGQTYMTNPKLDK